MSNVIDAERDIERFRDRETGQFGTQPHREPHYADSVGKYSEVSTELGSFQYPEPAILKGGVEEYIDFFMTVPIPEHLVREADIAYQRAYIEAKHQAERDAEHEVKMQVENDEDYVRWAMTTSVDEYAAGDKQIMDHATQIGRQRNAEAWPAGPRINASSVRTVLRIAQAVKLRRGFNNPETEQRILDHTHTWLSGKTETYQQIWERFRINDWIGRVL